MDVRRPMRTIRRSAPLALALSLGAAFGLLAAPAVTMASCMMPPPVAEALKTAEIVFVGTVTETSLTELTAAAARREA